eukprot:TRINITY_DN7425_c0_g1_i3.p1 TRINITY_DN7425_c0_g1~~TRINITY_DN7425_c0_g1_i3.p1  ORF type:complete len:356 (+),score=92.58 TRINITY_DN7425_c0_g1_i3:64-1131(+)
MCIRDSILTSKNSPLEDKENTCTENIEIQPNTSKSKSNTKLEDNGLRFQEALENAMQPRSGNMKDIPITENEFEKQRSPLTLPPTSSKNYNEIDINYDEDSQTEFQQLYDSQPPSMMPDGSAKAGQMLMASDQKSSRIMSSKNIDIKDAFSDSSEEEENKSCDDADGDDADEEEQAEDNVHHQNDCADSMDLFGDGNISHDLTQRLEPLNVDEMFKDSENASEDEIEQTNNHIKNLLPNFNKEAGADSSYSTGTRPLNANILKFSENLMKKLENIQIISAKNKRNDNKPRVLTSSLEASDLQRLKGVDSQMYSSKRQDDSSGNSEIVKKLSSDKNIFFKQTRNCKNYELHIHEQR